MKFASSITMIDPSFYLPLAKAAEESGYDVVTLSDSICYPEVSDSTYPYNEDGTRQFLENKPFLEATVAMAAMAAVTERVEFCPFVMKLPIRHPVLYAKEVSSLAVLSNNRISLGVGTSPWPDDYEVVGLPYRLRGRRFEECIAILRGLTAGGYFEFHGEFYDFPSIKIQPVPTEPIKILIGGHGLLNIERAARLADGWMPATIPPDVFIAKVEELQRLRKEYGRENEPFELYAFAPPDIDAIRALEDLGVTHCMSGYYGTFNGYGLAADTETLQEKIDRLHRFGDDIIAKY